MSHVVKRLEKQELGKIQHMARAIWPKVYDYMISSEQIEYMLNWMYSTEKLEEQWEGGCRFYVLEIEGEEAGFFSTELKNNELFLHKLYLNPDFHGKGWGKFLLNRVVEEAKDNDLKIIRLTVNRNNKSVKVYESFGFNIESEADFDIGNGYFMNDYVMTFRW